MLATNQQQQHSSGLDSPSRNLYMANLPPAPPLPKLRQASGDGSETGGGGGGGAQLFPMIMQAQQSSRLKSSDDLLRTATPYQLEITNSPAARSCGNNNGNMQLGMMVPIDSACREAEFSSQETNNAAQYHHLVLQRNCKNVDWV